MRDLTKNSCLDVTLNFLEYHFEKKKKNVSTRNYKFWRSSELVKQKILKF